jgi:predicted Zn-dependent peptidase
MLLGVAGDVSWRELRPRLERLVRGWPACAERLPRVPAPAMRTEPAVFLIRRPLEQSTVVMAHVADLRQTDSAPF